MHTLSESQSDPPTALPSRIATDEKQIEEIREKKGLYAAIDIESRLLLEIDVFSHRVTNPAAAFLHHLTEKQDVAETEFFVDAADYLTALAHRELSGQLDYRKKNNIENGFTPSPCESTAFTRFGGEVRPARNSGYDASDTTITTNDRIKRFTDERQLRRFRTRQ